MQVRDLMTENVVTIDASATVLEAAVLMRREDVGAVIVLEGDLYAGLISNRTIVQNVVAIGTDPSSVLVRDHMREDLVPAKPEDDVKTVARYIQEMKVRRLPVTADGRVAGVISVSDIAHFIKYYIDCILEEADERVERRKRY